MDISTANQSHANSQSWAGQNDRPPASLQGSCNPLHGFQHLSLGSPSDRRTCYDQLQASTQGCHSDVVTFSHPHKAPSIQFPNHVDQTAQRHIPGGLDSADPRSLLVGNEEMRPHSAHTPDQAIYPFQLPHTLQCSRDGPRSLCNEHHPPVGASSFGPNVNQSLSRSACERVNTESSVGYVLGSASPTSPAQQPPQWTPPVHSTGRLIHVSETPTGVGCLD